MTLSGWLLKLAEWRVDITVPDYAKCIICVAPHTSNWDFVLGKLAYWSVGRKTRFLMKQAWFVWPLGYFFRALGGIPVPPKRGSALTEHLIEMFDRAQRLTLAITPEGTRSRTERWRTGFLRIAYGAKDVQIVLGAFDYKERTITITKHYVPTGDLDQDLERIKEYYRHFHARYPDKFSV